MAAAPAIDSRFARILAHPLRQRIMAAYAVEESSPSRLAAALDAPVNVVSYHTGVLVRAGCVELVRTAKRRGATEHFYRATAQRDIGDEAWERLPRPVRRVLVRRLLEDAWDDATDALPAGGMDDATAHVSRTFMGLDAQGRAELAVLLRSTQAEAERICAASRARGDALPCELVMVSFVASRP